MTSPATTIVFDLDGTLVDTAPDLVASLNHTIAIKDLPPVSYEDLTHLVGQGARAMIARAFALRGAPLAEDELPALLKRFIDHYAAGMPGESRPYPGLIEALERLRGAGHLLAVCTNKMEGLARPLIEKLGLTGYFGCRPPDRHCRNGRRGGAQGADDRRQHQRHPGRPQRRHSLDRRAFRLLGRGRRHTRSLQGYRSFR